MSGVERMEGKASVIAQLPGSVSVYGPTWPQRIAAFAFVAVCVILTLCRQRGVGALDTIWAEDGTIFLQQALADPSPSVWLNQYGGYAHFLPRVLASLAAVLPIDWAAVTLSGGAALLAGVFALVALRASRAYLPSLPERIAVALCLVSLPAAGIEVMNAAANLHWYLLFVASCVVLWRPTTRLEVSVACGVLFISAASDPFVSILVPVAAWNYWKERRLSDVLPAAALLAGLIVQAFVIYFGESQRHLDPLATPITSLLSWYGFHVVMTSVFGIAIRDALVATIGTAPSAALAVVVLGALLLPAARLARRQPFIPVVLVAMHLGFYFLPVALSGFSPPRYSVTPILLLYLLIAWGVAGAEGRSRYLRAAAAVMLVTVIVADLAPHNLRADGPGWASELRSGRATCNAGAVAATIAIAPGKNSANNGDSWAVVVPCAILNEQRAAVE